MSEVKLAHVNAHSLLAGFTNFKYSLINNSYDVFLITESWLDSRVKSEFIGIDGYVLVREDRETRGGGVCMYIRNNISFEVVQPGQYNSFEHLWIKFNISKKRYCLGVVYRPPDANVNDFLNSFEEVIFNVFPICDEVICMGDINIDLLDTESGSTKKLHNLFNDFNLHQLIKEPTRLSLQRLSLLDVVISTKNAGIVSSGVDYSQDLQTDHELIFCNIERPHYRSTPIFRTIRDFNNIDNDYFIQDLLSLPFDNILYIINIDEKVQYFNHLIVSLFDRHAPFKAIRCSKPKSPWLTDNIKFMINLRNRAKLKYRHSQNPHDYESYKSLRNLITKTINIEKKVYLNHIIKQNKSKLMWETLHNFNVYATKKKSQIFHLI